MRTAQRDPPVVFSPNPVGGKNVRRQAVEHWWSVDGDKMIPRGYDGVDGVRGASAHPAEQPTGLGKEPLVLMQTASDEERRVSSVVGRRKAGNLDWLAAETPRLSRSRWCWTWHGTACTMDCTLYML
jgi:hypothetical protein